MGSEGGGKGGDEGGGARGAGRAGNGRGRDRTEDPRGLGVLKLLAVKADRGPPKGVYYRLRAGPLADKEAARALCAKLAARKAGCLVVGPAGSQEQKQGVIREMRHVHM